MSGPLIPYVDVPPLPLRFLLHVPGLSRLFDPADPPSIKPFGVLVVIGIYVGWGLALRRAKERGLDLKKMNDFALWVIVGGFVFGHVLDALLYHPDVVRKNPIFVLMIWASLSSYGGFAGAVIGGVAWRFFRKESMFAYTEVLSSVFPIGWVFGRAGCAAVHDHPGRYSDAWFAVRWPMGHGVVGRFDLGLYEMLLTIPLAVAFTILWRRDRFRPLGFYTGLFCALYAPVRFLLDFLREDEAGGTLGGDKRYGGLTPAQWGCFLLLATGLWLLLRTRREPRTVPPTPAPDAA